MKTPTWAQTRAVLSYFFGLGGLVYEAVIRHPPDYALVPVFVGMLGLPAFTRSDKRNVKPKPQPHPHPQPQALDAGGDQDASVEV